MTTSNTNTFTQVKNQIIQQAYSRIGVLTDENELTAYQIEKGSDILNMMIKAWIQQGIRLWKIARGTLFLQPRQSSYILDGSSANATELFSETLVSVNAIAGTTSITVDDTLGFVVGYNIGITQDNNYIHWSIISSIVGNVVNFTTPLTYATSIYLPVYSYQTKINRPENIVNAQCAMNNQIQISMQMLSRDTYDALAIKREGSIPTQLYYNKQLNYGEIQIFGTPQSSIYKIKFSFEKQFFDMTDPLNNFDFPTEWLEALYLNLAKRLAGFNSIKDPQFLADLKEEAATALSLAKQFDDELTSIYFFPASDENRGGYL